MTSRTDLRPVWVFGGGGVAGIAWEIGILAGLADERINVSPDAILIGTSAGSVVGAQLASGESIELLYELQVSGRVAGKSSSLRFIDAVRLASAAAFARSPESAARHLGSLAAGAGAPSNLVAIQSRLPSHEWGERDLRIVVVDVESGTHRVLTRADGISLVDAVAASSAVPLVYAPVKIDGRKYMDGGMRGTVNLDLADGDGPVIALAPSVVSLSRWARIATQRAALGPERVVEVLQQDATSRRVQGRDVMDRSVVPALVAVAREQGRREAPRVALAVT